MVPFLLAAAALFVGIGSFYYFFFRRLFHTFQWNPCSKRPALPALLCAAAATLSCFLIFTDFGILSVFLLYLMGFGLLLTGINGMFRRLAKQAYQNGMKTWKKLYGSGILSAILALCMIVGGMINLNHVRKTTYTVTTEKEIRGEGYQVALLADVHYGVSLGREELTALCEEINAQNPDLVVLCGDLVDSSTSKEGMQELFSILGTLKSEFGTFFVYGNHDRSFYGVGNPFTDEEMVQTIADNGITLLKDETVQLTEDLLLAGREDASREKRKSAEELLKNADPDDFLLVLDHQPHEYDEQKALGTDLLLSGHTHGGQIFPVNLLMEIIPFNDGTYGAYALGEKGTAIVTSGVAGWNIPVKTAAPAEYVIIEIRKS